MIVPAKPHLSRLSMTTLPCEARLADAPMTAIFFGRTRGVTSRTNRHLYYAGERRHMLGPEITDSALILLVFGYPDFLPVRVCVECDVELSIDIFKPGR